MLADGLTKALPKAPFKTFVEQLGLVDINQFKKQLNEGEASQTPGLVTEMAILATGITSGSSKTKS
jgi:hypothetical protein